LVLITHPVLATPLSKALKLESVMNHGYKLLKVTQLTYRVNMGRFPEPTILTSLPYELQSDFKLKSASYFRVLPVLV